MAESYLRNNRFLGQEKRVNEIIRNLRTVSKNANEVAGRTVYSGNPMALNSGPMAGAASNLSVPAAIHPGNAYKYAKNGKQIKIMSVDNEKATVLVEGKNDSITLPTSFLQRNIKTGLYMNILPENYLQRLKEIGVKNDKMANNLYNMDKKGLEKLALGGNKILRQAAEIALEWKEAQNGNPYVHNELDNSRRTGYNESADRKLFEQYSELLGKNAPNNFKDFQKLKYSGDWNDFKAYAKSIECGELTPLVGFELYKNTGTEVDRILVGQTTYDGINITGKSNHFVARIIGSVEQRRNGVSVADTLETLLHPAEICPIKTAANGNSQKFKGPKSFVTINPDTGLLIQVNPRKTYHRKVVE